MTRKELKAFVQKALKDVQSGAFAPKASVCNCTILRITDKDRGDSDLHGLVEVQPAKAAMLAIERLNKETLRGEKIEVRRYHHRSLLRDRRREPTVGTCSDNRHGERRRRNLKIELINA
jgi:hypothetical protein